MAGNRQTRRQKNGDLCLALTLTALILAVPANCLPFMKLELYGDIQSSTIWQGVVALIQSQEWFVGIVIFFASLVIPFIKIFILIYLSIRLRVSKSLSQFDRYVHRTIEVLGRWSMLDIFLVAILVSMMKFGTLAHVEISAGAIFFLWVVILTMIVSEIISHEINRFKAVEDGSSYES